MYSSFIVSEASCRMSVIGVPVKVLHEAEGHIVTIETTSGEVKSIPNQTMYETFRMDC